MIQLADAAPAEKKAPAAPKKAAPAAPEEKKKAPVVPKRSDKPHAGHSEVHKPHESPKVEEPKAAAPKVEGPKKAAPKKAAPEAAPVKKEEKKAAPAKKEAKKAAPKAAPKKALEPGSPAAAKAELEKEALKAAGVSKLGESPENAKVMPEMPCGYPFQDCPQNKATADPKDPYSEGSTKTPALSAHLEAEKLMAKVPKGKVDELNTFPTPEAKQATAEKIAKRIFDKANAAVSKANEETETDAAVNSIKTVFKKSVGFVKGLVASAKSDNGKMLASDGEESAEGGEVSAEDAKKAAVGAMSNPLKDEDDKLIKSLPQKASPEAIAAVEKEAKAHTKP